MDEARYRVEARDITGSTEIYYTSRKPQWYDDNTFLIENESNTFLLAKNHISIKVSRQEENTND